MVMKADTYIKTHLLQFANDEAVLIMVLRGIAEAWGG
jgi:hypothetical protein